MGDTLAEKPALSKGLKMFSFIDRNGNIIHSVRNLDLRRKENTGLRRYNPPPRFISPDGVIHERIGFIDLRRKGNDFKRV